MTPDSTNTEDAKTKVQKTAADAADSLRSGAQDAAHKVSSEAAQYADQAKGAAADEVKGVASALRTAADEMRSGSPQERTMSQIAEGLADVSESLRDQDLGQMVGTVSEFARRNPIAFLGGAALIGFAATRFAKASSDRNDRTQSYDNAPSHNSPTASDYTRPGSATPLNEGRT